MSMIEQMNQAEGDTTGSVFTFRDSNGGTVLFDRATGKSCAVAYTCPMTGTDSCAGADSSKCPAC